MSTLPNTAILIFANSSKEELARKPLVYSKELFDTLTVNILKKAKQTKLPVFHFSEKEQIGEDFGSRFTNAISSVFNKGFHKIIVIGNDTPQLKTKHLYLAKEALENGKTVLGPCLDGGFYLLGIHKSNFDQKEFKQLPWQRYNLLKEISILLNQVQCVIFDLPVLQDIDTIQDVRRLNNFTLTVSVKVRRLLNKIITTVTFIFIEIDVFVYTSISQIPFNKGSPLQLLQ